MHQAVPMDPIRSKITSQGQISVPAKIRKKLGLAPGSIIEWEEKNDEVIVKKAITYTLEDLHEKIFPEGPPPRKSLDDLKEGIKDYIKKKHARR